MEDEEGEEEEDEEGEEQEEEVNLVGFPNYLVDLAPESVGDGLRTWSRTSAP